MNFDDVVPEVLGWGGGDFFFETVKDFNRLCPKSGLCEEDVPTQRRKALRVSKGFSLRLGALAREIFRRYMRLEYFSRKPLNPPH